MSNQQTKCKRQRIRRAYDRTRAKLVASTTVMKRQGVDFSSILFNFKPSKSELLINHINSLR